MQSGVSATVKSIIGRVGGIRRVIFKGNIDPRGPIFTICSLACGATGVAFVTRVAAAQVSQNATAAEAWFTFTIWSTAVALFYWSVYMCTMFEFARQTAEQSDDISRSSCLIASATSTFSPARESLISLIVWTGLLLLLPYISGVSSTEGGSGILAAAVAVAIVLHTLMCILRLPVLWYSAGIKSSDVAQQLIE
jgi:hypothetical protein